MDRYMYRPAPVTVLVVMVIFPFVEPVLYGCCEPGHARALVLSTRRRCGSGGLVLVRNSEGVSSLDGGPGPLLTPDASTVAGILV